MRTTVTLDPDVERLIRDAMRERAISFKEALNEAARIGLCGKGPKRARKFAQKSFRMGESPEFHWDKALDFADAIEDQELSRKITLQPGASSAGTKARSEEPGLTLIQKPYTTSELVRTIRTPTETN
jgi:hypothetical protein